MLTKAQLQNERHWHCSLRTAKQKPGVTTFLVAFLLLGLSLELSSHSHSKFTPEQTKYTEPIKHCWQVQHSSHPTCRSKTIFYLVNGVCVDNSPSSPSSIYMFGNRNHLIYGELVARNFSVFLCQQFTHPLRFLRTVL